MAKLSRRVWTGRLLMVEALGALVLASLAVSVLPRRFLTRYYGQFQTETPAELSTALESRAYYIGRVLRAAKRYIPWKATCLMDAMAGKLMLTRRRIPHTLYIGFRSNTAPDGLLMEGHAWLRSGRFVLTGGLDSESYTVVAYYGSKR